MNKQQTWTEQEIAVLRQEYPTLGPKNLAPKFNRSWESVYNKARALKIKVNHENRHDRNLNKHDISALTTSKTPEGCYILGLLWADGHVAKHKPGAAFSISACFIASDFQDFGPVFSKTCNWRFYPKKAGKRNSAAMRIAISDARLHSFLVEMGYMLKSLETCDKIIANIPARLRHYFWRGFFDGDGYIGIKPRNKSLVLTGALQQNWTTLEILLNHLEIQYSIHRVLSKNGKCSRVRISNISGIRKFGEYLFQGCIFGLSRKRIKFTQL